MTNTAGPSKEFDPLNVSVEEFENLSGNHEFSALYQSRKKAVIASAANTAARRPSARAARRTGWHIPRAAAAALVAVCVLAPAGAWAAANHVDFFANAFGDGWRTSVPAKEGVQPGSGEKGDAYFTYPAREIVDVDPQLAEELIGDAVMSEPVSASAWNHTLTITSAVRSENEMVYAFTLECPTGVTAITWDEGTNRAKGAYTAEDSQMAWCVANDKVSNEYVYVDTERSTDTVVYGYGYVVFGDEIPDGDAVTLEIVSADKPFDEASVTEISSEYVDLNVTKAIDAQTFVANDGTTSMSISPLGIVWDASNAPTHSNVTDPYYTRSLVIEYKDGTTYTVFDDNTNIDNTSVACTFGAETVSADRTLSKYAFNRLVDPSAIASVTVETVNPDDAAALSNDESLASLPTETVVYTHA